MARRNRDEVAARLLEFAIATPTWTQGEAAYSLEIGRSTVQQGIQQVRHMLGNDDTVNLICDPPPGRRGEWIYQLTGNLDHARKWINNQQQISLGLLDTVISVVRSFVRAYPAETIEGKRGRRVLRSLSRAHEDMAELDLD